MEKITDLDIIADDAFNAGSEGRESARLPDRYAQEGENWLIWAENWEHGQRELQGEAEYYLADAKSPDATGQDQWRQDEAVDLDYGYHSYHEM